MRTLIKCCRFDFSQKSSEPSTFFVKQLQRKLIYSSIFILTKLYNQNSYQNFIHNFINNPHKILYISHSNN
jgi:hypothetical protein